MYKLVINKFIEVLAILNIENGPFDNAIQTVQNIQSIYILSTFK